MKLKIPPVIQFLFFAFLMWLTHRFTNDLHFIFTYQYKLSWTFIFAGVFIGILGVYAFRFAKTTVDPRQPNKATSLVVNGIYKYTRNPMYLGLLFLLIGWFIRLGNLYNILFPIFYVFYITEFQIKPEEAALKAHFGDQYLNYLDSVRRWI